MVQLNKILVPTDFSKFSFRASDFAVALARQFDASIHFVHVIPAALLHPDQYPYVSTPIVPGPEVKAAALERLDAFVALARAENVETGISVVEGTPVDCVLDVASEQHADLICMGTHGREGLERLVLGSVAERVLRKSPVPVLTVSEPGSENTVAAAPFKKILCPVDFAVLSLRALEYSMSLAKEVRGELVLLNVVEWFSEEPGWEATVSVSEYREQAEAQVRDRLEELVPENLREECEVEILVRSGKPYRHVLEVARDKKTDLIVMGVRGRNPLDLMLFGSTTQHVVRHAECPIITVPRGK